MRVGAVTNKILLLPKDKFCDVTFFHAPESTIIEFNFVR